MKRIANAQRGCDWVLTFCALLLLFAAWSGPVAAKPPPQPPNILYIVLDDVGIDQMRLFGYGGATPPRTPNIDAIASAGVAFRNMWTMPECSPSRALMFEGRYPLRTNVLNAILSVDLANSQVSPYETTTPIVLRQRGYVSGLFGKFHLTGSNLGPTNNPLGDTAVYQLGWNYFVGWEDGAPYPIDTTAGGVVPSPGVYTCGFVPNKSDDPANGADSGACYGVNGSCTMLAAGTLSPTPGRTCLERGGIFDPNKTCQSPVPSYVNFATQNGYYVGQLVINRPDGASTVFAPNDPSGAGRRYRTLMESDRAIQWINQRSQNRPWMATLAYSAIHSPYQQPPTALLPTASVATGGFNCTGAADQRVLSNQMIEATDAEIGRVLVETGLATRKRDGSLNYDPSRSDTMIVLIGDNGTYAPGVKAPFNPLRAKATVYQTGVWVPLVIAGPLVKAPGREVESMVNIADLFQLFGEIAGIDVHDVVPKSRAIDSVSMLPYLTNPRQKSLRSTNFTQTADNIKPVGYVVPPCVVASVNTCVQLFPQRSLCESEGGAWWGSGGAGAGAPQSDCCGVTKWLMQNSPQTALPAVLPSSQMAIRNDQYKLVKYATPGYDATTDTCVTTNSTELYEIDQNVPPKLDNAERNLLAPPHELNGQERRAFAQLSAELSNLVASQPSCPGDGNLDGKVNAQDVVDWHYWTTINGGNSSWYDFNYDGVTNNLDFNVIYDNLGTKCPKPK
jgi:hypothetical protein